LFKIAFPFCPGLIAHLTVGFPCLPSNLAPLRLSPPPYIDFGLLSVF
jgi:hypothetical protein